MGKFFEQERKKKKKVGMVLTINKAGLRNTVGHSLEHTSDAVYASPHYGTEAINTEIASAVHPQNRKSREFSRGAGNKSRSR